MSSETELKKAVKSKLGSMASHFSRLKSLAVHNVWYENKLVILCVPLLHRAVSANQNIVSV